MTNTLHTAVAWQSITPSAGSIDNTLHSVMRVRTDVPGSPMRAKALALTFNGRTRLLVALDLCVVPTDAAWEMRRAIAAATGVRVDDIVLWASHSHSTPFLEPGPLPGAGAGAVPGARPFYELVLGGVLEAAQEAVAAQVPARIGWGGTHVVGASFNTRKPMPGDGVKFARDFREGLATGRPIDPRLTVVRVDRSDGTPLAGWVIFAAHPACVIVDAPLSAEYPGYMTDRLAELADGNPAFLFAYGAAGDVNCIPMFGQESDSRDLGLRLAGIVAPLFAGIRTAVPRRFGGSAHALDLPLDPVPTVAQLDREIAEVEAFQAALDTQPELEWVLGINCKKEWPAARKKAHAAPLAEWARLVKQALAAGREFPRTWPREAAAWVIDDLGLVFEGGETLVEVSLDVAARSPLAETRVVSLCNGATPYLGSDEDRRRAGYETFTCPRYAKLADGAQPLPYALGAAEVFTRGVLSLLQEAAALPLSPGERVACTHAG